MHAGDLPALLDTHFPAHKPVPDAYRSLTGQERDGFRAVARGLPNAEMYAGESTVKTHVGAILRKLSLRDRCRSSCSHTSTGCSLSQAAEAVSGAYLSPDRGKSMT